MFCPTPPPPQVQETNGPICIIARAFDSLKVQRRKPKVLKTTDALRFWLPMKPQVEKRQNFRQHAMALSGIIVVSEKNKSTNQRGWHLGHFKIMKVAAFGSSLRAFTNIFDSSIEYHFNLVFFHIVFWHIAKNIRICKDDKTFIWTGSPTFPNFPFWQAYCN